MLDKVMAFRPLPFPEWWSEGVFWDPKRGPMSRKHLILVAADQDGGGHVDPKLDEAYAHLKANALMLTTEKPDGPSLILGAEAAAIRQIAHEALKSLIPGYSREPDMTDVTMVTGDLAFSASGPGMDGWTVQFGNARTMPAKQGRNERCACGSGKKFKYCHGYLR